MPDSAKGSLLILAGPPGAGKSTIAKQLAKTSERPCCHLHADSFYTAIRKGYVPPYLPEAQRQNEVVIGVVTEAAAGYARGGYDVVLDGIVGPWFLPPFQAMRDKERIELHYVVLRPSLEETLGRAASREGRVLKEVEPIKGLYRAFADLGRLEAHVVDSSAQSVAETTAAIRSAVALGKFKL